jgi:oligoribonuclease
VVEAAPRKETTHRALDDIRESVNELRWYRQHLFKLAAAEGQVPG